MKKIIALVLAVTLCSAVFSGCGSDPKKVVKVYNAAEYIAEGVIEEFEKETGYKVVYSEFASNEDMYTKIKTTSYDVLVPSDYMIDKLVKEDLIQPLNFDNIPNYQYIDETFKSPYYDENDQYSVPYMWSTVGILYDGDKVTDEVDDMSIMWNEKYSGKIFMLDRKRQRACPGERRTVKTAPLNFGLCNRRSERQNYFRRGLSWPGVFRRSRKGNGGKGLFKICHS